MDEELLWDCPYCGLETPQPTLHLARAHNMTIEEFVRQVDELEARRKEMERVLLMEKVFFHRFSPGPWDLDEDGE